MRRVSKYSRGFLLLLAVVACGAVRLGAQDIADGGRAAVKLTRIWTRLGTETMHVGERVASLGDLNGDGLGDFAVQRYAALEVYLGARPAPSSTPTWVIDTSVVRLSPKDVAALGDFWSTGHRAVCLTQRFDIVVYRTESGVMADAPSARLTRERAGGWKRALDGMHAADVDSDGYDELIVASHRGANSSISDNHAEVWIFRGGPDFALDEPDYIIRDDEEHLGSRAAVRCADIDGDGNADVVTVVDQYRGSLATKMKIYFGNGRVDGYPQTPDRVVETSSIRVFLPDVDGDAIGDILLDFDRMTVFRSGAGKSARTRSYTAEDVDLIDTEPGRGVELGPLNDNSRRYAMVGSKGAALRAYSGGPGGPDGFFDAWYYATADGFISDNWNRFSAPLGDVNGDGWNDVIFGDDYHPSDAMPGGIAIILGGGAYIPRDSFDISAIRDIAIADLADALTVWPLPARDHVTIAWRGDLEEMPARIDVHDALGRSILSQRLGWGASHVQLECAGWLAGVYVVSLRDALGRVIATLSIPHIWNRLSEPDVGQRRIGRTTGAAGVSHIRHYSNTHRDLSRSTSQRSP